MSVLYLAIQHTYTEVQLGLYRNGNNIDSVLIHKHQASSLLPQAIKDLLAQHQANLSQLSFIAVNQGPGPYTTLRVVIATVNGLSFALGIPLVGVDGIKTLVSESIQQSTGKHVALLNAFNHDVYFAIRSEAETIESGYANIDTLLDMLKSKEDGQDLFFLGNGSVMHQELIKKTFPRAVFDPVLIHCSLNALAQEGLRAWNEKKQISTQLQPLYLKNMFGKTVNLAK